MAYIVTIHRNTEPAEQQLSTVARDIERRFHGKVRVNVLSKLATLLLDFSIPVAICDVRSALSSCTSIKGIEDEDKIGLPPFNVERPPVADEHNSWPFE